MNAEELKKLQAPLKESYRERPEEGATVARAEARPGGDVTCTVETWAGETVAGLHPATGGDGSVACSADMLMEALVACAGVTLSSLATHMGITLHDAVVRAEGRWDARGTLGVSRDAPVGLTRVDLFFDLETDADESLESKLVELTERYCVIYQTLRNPPEVRVHGSGSSPGGA